MNRSIGLLAALSFGGIACQARAEDPKTKFEPKPQWQRLLQGDDAKKATELRKSIDETEATEPEENEDIVGWFLDHSPQYRRISAAVANPALRFGWQRRNDHSDSKDLGRLGDACPRG